MQELNIKNEEIHNELNNDIHEQRKNETHKDINNKTKYRPLINYNSI